MRPIRARPSARRALSVVSVRARVVRHPNCRFASIVAVCLMSSLAACGRTGVSSSALRSYVKSVEPIRVGVNRLLEGADPVLDAYRERRITPDKAVVAMAHLERQFATATVEINGLRPSDSTLRRVNAPYAHTYVLEDAYLSALVAVLRTGEFRDLPDTQSAQRAAIVAWRTELVVLSRQTGVRLPADIERAGRGEIAPSPVEGT